MSVKGGSSGGKGGAIKFGFFASALKNVTDVVTIPICPDLVAYRLSLRPILDKVIGGSQRITQMKVDRNQIFKQAMSYYKSSRSDIHEQLMVTFLNDGLEEEAMDGGGVRREFYSSFFKECLKEANMFVGTGRRKLPSNDMNMVQNGYFEALGRAIVASILNGDCGFPYLAPVVFYYLVDEDPTPYLNVQDIPDIDIKSLVEKLIAAKTDDEIFAVVTDATVIDHIGWPPGQAFSMKTRDALVQQLTRWSIIDKRMSSLDKLKQGLNHMGFLNATKKNPLLLPLLVYSSEYKITAEYFRSKVVSQIEEMTCKNESQKKSKNFMIEYLKVLTDEDAQALFQFITGAADPPVEEETISVEFNSFKQTQKFPEANTCSSKLWIPVGNSNISEFKNSVKYALDNAKQGFGNS